MVGQTEIHYCLIQVLVCNNSAALPSSRRTGSNLCSRSHLVKLSVDDRSKFQVRSSVIALTEARWIPTTSLGSNKCETTRTVKAWGQRRSPARRLHPLDDGSVGPLTTPKCRPNSIIPAKALCSTVWPENDDMISQNITQNKANLSLALFNLQEGQI